MRPPPIRLQISVLLLLTTLNVALLGSLSFFLFAALSASPSPERLAISQAFDGQFAAVQVRVGESVATRTATPPEVREGIAATRSALAPLGPDAARLLDDLRDYQTVLDAWDRHAASAPPVGMPDAAGDELEHRISRSGLYITSAAREFASYTRPAWVDAAEPYLPWLLGWVVGVSVANVALAYGLREVLSRPLHAITAAARAVADGDLEARMPPPSGAPELRTLLSAIAAARDRLVDTIDVLDLQKRKTDTMLSQLADGVLLVDPAGSIVEANLTGQVLLTGFACGWPKRLALPVLIPELTPAHFAAEADATLELHRRVATRARTYQTSLRRLPHPPGRPLGWVVILRDVTADRELEDVKREFMSVVTHELKTPLVSIEGFAKLLLMNKAGELTDKQRRWVTSIREQGQVMLTMVTNLLEITRLEGGNLTISRAPVSVAELTDELCGMWRPAVEGRGFSFGMSPPVPAGPEVNVDRQRMQQVIGNLIGNALKFTPPGGEIGISSAVTDTEALVTVHDSGRGIPAAAIPRLFEKFFQVEMGDTRIAGGVGLGLFIVHQLVLAQGGELTVESEEGRGSRFQIRLPLFKPGGAP